MPWTQQTFKDWTVWTPTLTATGTNPTGFSAYTNFNVYQKVGSLVIVRFGMATFANTGNSAGTGNWRLSLPIQPKHSSGYSACGDFYLYNSNNDAWNVAVCGEMTLHPTSQSTSTVEFVTVGNNSTNNLDVLPANLNYTSTVMMFNGQLFYEAL